MALFNYTYLNKHGIKITKILYSESSSIGFSSKDLKNHMMLSPFKYQYKHPLIPPVIYKDSNGDLFLNSNQKLHPQTTLDDIFWDKPKQKEETRTLFEFKSNSSDVIYNVIKNEKGNKISFSCNCPGVWRSKDRQCKHIKSLMN